MAWLQEMPVSSSRASIRFTGQRIPSFAGDLPIQNLIQSNNCAMNQALFPFAIGTARLKHLVRFQRGLQMLLCRKNHPEMLQKMLHATLRCNNFSLHNSTLSTGAPDRKAPSEMMNH